MVISFRLTSVLIPFLLTAARAPTAAAKAASTPGEGYESPDVDRVHEVALVQLASGHVPAPTGIAHISANAEVTEVVAERPEALPVLNGAGPELNLHGSGAQDTLEVATESSRVIAEGLTVAVSFGRPDCPCIAVDYSGKVSMTTSGGPVQYPAGTGASCGMWDFNLHPSCTGSKRESWCSQQWCFVDACNCNAPVPPKSSTYLPNASFHGDPIYYSYSTCNGTDEFTAGHVQGACTNQKTKADCAKNAQCLWASKGCVGKEVEGEGSCKTQPAELTFGKEACRCIGISNLTGNVNAVVQGSTVSYPADLGSSCKAWDEGHHPQCMGTINSGFCSNPWCYVDPCSCNIDVIPKRITYVADATYQGKPLFYSYRTCGVVDTYTTTDNTNACPNAVSSFQCGQKKQCTWLVGKGCVHQDIIAVCGAGVYGTGSALRLAALGPAVALLVAVVALLA